MGKATECNTKASSYSVDSASPRGEDAGRSGNSGALADAVIDGEAPRATREPDPSTDGPEASASSSAPLPAGWAPSSSNMLAVGVWAGGGFNTVRNPIQGQTWWFEYKRKANHTPVATETQTTRRPTHWSQLVLKPWTRWGGF